MGGYAALHIAFEQPGLVAAVATHSAMLLERIPSADQGARAAGTWPPSTRSSATRSTPRSGPRTTRSPGRAKVDPKAAPALYFDCGAEDRYGLASGHRELHRILDERGIAHTFELPPGDHGYEFVRSRLEKSLRFLDRALGGVAGR